MIGSLWLEFKWGEGELSEFIDRSSFFFAVGNGNPMESLREYEVPSVSKGCSRWDFPFFLIGKCILLKSSSKWKLIH